MPLARSAPRFLALLGFACVAASAACMQVPPQSADSSNDTRQAADEIVPTAQGPSTPSAGPSGSGTGTGTAGLGPTPVGGQLSISILASADLCLSITEPTSPTPNSLVLRSCANVPAQRWLFRDGLLQSGTGRCIQAVINGTTATPTLAGCDGNNLAQHFVRDGANLAVQIATGAYALAVTSAPSTASVIEMAPLNASTPTQAWGMAQDTHNDQGALVLAGTHISSVENANSCLSNKDGVLRFAPCADDIGQAWRLNPQGGIQNQGRCLDVSATQISAILCNLGPSQRWLIKDGWLYSYAANGNKGGCVDVAKPDVSTPVITGCQASSGHFVIGQAF